MNREVLSKYNDMSVGEAAGITLAQEPELVDDRRHELNEIFNFDAVRVNRRGRKVEPLVLTDLKAIYTNHEKVLGKHDWDTVFLSNHDNPRIVSTFGDDSPEFRVPSAKLFEAMILTLKGTPYLFQGDELGMTNYPFKTIADYNDIEAKNAWKDEVETRHTLSADRYLAELRESSRDNARTPMQWTNGPNAGFTTASAKPWLAVNPNYTTINAARKPPIRTLSTTTPANSSPFAPEPQPSSMATSKTWTPTILKSSSTPEPSTATSTSSFTISPRNQSTTPCPTT